TTAPTTPSIYTLSLHDALPISDAAEVVLARLPAAAAAELDRMAVGDPGLREGVSERDLVELRVAARSRKAADVDERPETGLLQRSEEHTSELQSPYDLVCRLLL